MLLSRSAAVLAVAGMSVAVLPAAAHAGVPVGPASPGLPASSVRVAGFGQVKYCVVNYAPGTRVSIAAPDGGRVTIRTTNAGSGCTALPYQSVCNPGAGRVIVATGTGADGNPATSSATLANDASAPTCTPQASAHTGTTGDGLSGTALGVLGGVAGLAVLGGLALLVILRRRAAG